MHLVISLLKNYNKFNLDNICDRCDNLSDWGSTTKLNLVLNL